MTTTKIGPGTRFHSVLADGNPEWEVTRSRGRGVWEAKCLGDDFAGTVHVFTTEQVRRAVGMKELFKRVGDEHDKFYDSLKLGQIVHVDNGFQNWIRCEVVIGTTVHKKSPHKCLKPIALCGTWHKHDLPRRWPNGEIDLGYQAKNIVEGTCFEPNYGCIYEADKDRYKNVANPKALPALDLSVPELAANEAAKAKLWKAVEEARNALDNCRPGADPKALLESARAIIQAAI